MDLVKLSTPDLSWLGGDVSVGAGIGSWRAWLVAVVVVALVVAFGWWLRRPKRRRAPTVGSPTVGAAASDTPTVEDLPRPMPPEDAGPRPVVRGPDDDEEFLRSLARRYPPPRDRPDRDDLP